MTIAVKARPDAAEVVVDLHRRLAEHGHDLSLELWDGRRLGPQDAPYRIVLRHPWALRSALLPPGDLTAGEAYLADDLDVAGSMVAALADISELRNSSLDLLDQTVVVARLLRLPAPPDRRSGRGRVRLRGRIHSTARDAAAVRHHYDVGNDFYRRFLDRDLVYSCAVFSEEERAAPVSDRAVLDRAQRRKLDLVCRKLHLQPGEHLLDVGCGWGSLVIHAARTYGVTAHGITLSPPQAELARERVAEAGLSDRVRIEVAHERDVTGSYDAIASVGMVEHVGADQLDRYAGHLFELLRPGGRLLNHGITTGTRNVVRDLARDRDSFVARYVFPDGALVPAHVTVAAIERAGFELWDVQQLRPHYTRTLAHWVANLEASADEARDLVGDTTYRVWRAYMAGSSVAFDRGDLGVVQILGVRPPHRLPFGRDWMQPRA